MNNYLEAATEGANYTSAERDIAAIPEGVQ